MTALLIVSSDNSGLDELLRSGGGRLLEPGSEVVSLSATAESRSMQIVMEFPSEQDATNAFRALDEGQVSSATVVPIDTPAPPPVRRERLALLVWVAVYVLLNAFLILTAPLLGPAPLLVRTLVATAIVVPIIVVWVIPFIMRRFAGWLSAAS